MLQIEASKSTPRVFYDQASKTLELSGEAYPENSFAFFDPIFTWLSQTLDQESEFTLRLNIRYMNSSSTRCILDMFDMLAAAFAKGRKVSVHWQYKAGNERALELAKEFYEDFEFPFTIEAV